MRNGIFWVKLPFGSARFSPQKKQSGQDVGRFFLIFWGGRGLRMNEVLASKCVKVTTPSGFHIPRVEKSH